LQEGGISWSQGKIEGDCCTFLDEAERSEVRQEKAALSSARHTKLYREGHPWGRGGEGSFQ